MTSFAKGIPLVALALALAGCANYHAGTSVPRELRTIAVPTFANASGMPQVEAIATQAVLTEFRREGTMKITERENAALEMEGRITHCKLDSLRFDHDSPYRTVEYRLVITADVKVYERASGKVVAKFTKVTGDDIFRAASDLPSTERDALPRAAARLAKTIVNETLMSW
jgi:hypothetical protein